MSDNFNIDDNVYDNEHYIYLCFKDNTKQPLFLPKTALYIIDGDNNNIKSEFLNRIKFKFNIKNKDDVIYLPKDFISTSILLNDAQRLMMERYKNMELEQVSNFTQVTNIISPYKQRLYIIENFDEYFDKDNYKCIDNIKSAISSIARLGKAAGIILLITVNTLENIITKDMLSNTPGIILSGNIKSFDIKMIENNYNIKMPDEYDDLYITYNTYTFLNM